MPGYTIESITPLSPLRIDDIDKLWFQRSSSDKETIYIELSG
jgi:hypothetical protein